jgi:hypothetical protein
MQTEKPWAILLTIKTTPMVFSRYTLRADAETDLIKFRRYLPEFTLEICWHE